MFSSTRGNSFGIAKKVLCVIMAISLSLMMLPSTLFKTQANAAEVQDTNRVNAADLFKFSYAENSNGANKTTLTQADLLDVLNNRPVDITAAKAQGIAENELKVQLDKANLFLEPGEALLAKEGAKFTDPSVESLALKDVTTNNLNGHIYFAKDAQTNNFDVTTSNVAENLSGAIDVAINYAQWDATYEVYFSTNSVVVPLSSVWTEVDATTAIIKYRFSQTGNAIDGKPTYNLETSIQVKNNTKNPTTFTANIEKTTSEATTNTDSIDQNSSQNAISQTSNNEYIKGDLITFNDNYVGKPNVKIDVTSLYLKDSEKYSDINVNKTNVPQGIDCTFDSIQNIIILNFKTAISSTASECNFKISISGTYTEGSVSFPEEDVPIKLDGGVNGVVKPSLATPIENAKVGYSYEVDKSDIFNDEHYSDITVNGVVEESEFIDNLVYDSDSGKLSFKCVKLSTESSLEVPVTISGTYTVSNEDFSETFNIVFSGGINNPYVKSNIEINDAQYLKTTVLGKDDIFNDEYADGCSLTECGTPVIAPTNKAECTVDTEYTTISIKYLDTYNDTITITIDGISGTYTDSGENVTPFANEKTTITINNIGKLQISFDPTSVEGLSEVDMRVEEAQRAYIADILDDTILDNSVAETIYLGCDEDGYLWDSYVNVFADEDQELVLASPAPPSNEGCGFYLYIEDGNAEADVTDKCTLNFDNPLKVKPATSWTYEELVFQWKENETTITKNILQEGLKTEWIRSNDAAFLVKTSSPGVTYCYTYSAPEQFPSSFFGDDNNKPLSSKTSGSYPFNLYTQANSTDVSANGIVKTFRTCLIRFDKEKPNYISYSVEKGDEGTYKVFDWNPVNMFNNIINAINNALFAYGDVKVKFNLDDLPAEGDGKSEIPENGVQIKTSPDQEEWETLAYDNTEKCCIKTIPIEEGASYEDIDLSDWNIKAQDNAGNEISDVPIIKGDETIKKIVWDEEVYQYQYTWYHKSGGDWVINKDAHNPLPIVNYDQKLDVVIDDPSFAYTRSVKAGDPVFTLTTKTATGTSSSTYYYGPSHDQTSRCFNLVDGKYVLSIPLEISNDNWADYNISFPTSGVESIGLQDMIPRSATVSDGSYTMEVEAAKENSPWQDFRIDKEAPKLQNITWNTSKDSGHYNEIRTATLHITEHNFSLEKGQRSALIVNGLIKDNNGAIKTNIVLAHENWVPEQNITDGYKATFSFGDSKIDDFEGNCSFIMYGKDVAENVFVDNNDKPHADVSNAYKVEFVQDWTEPVFTTEWVNDLTPSRYASDCPEGFKHDYYNGEDGTVNNIRTLKICVTEKYSWSDKLMILHKDGFAEEGAVYEFYKTIDCSSVGWTKDSDGKYSAYVLCKDNLHHEFSIDGSDLAENDAEYDDRGIRKDKYQSETFVLDSIHPTVKVGWDKEARYNRYLNMEGAEVATATITVTEHNFYGDFINIKYDFTNNGRTYTETKTVDTINDNWNHNRDTHTLKTEFVKFGDEGDYDISVAGEDIATNTLNNTDTKTDPAYTWLFTIDKTNPTGSILFDNNNVVNGKYFTGARTATITINERNFYDGSHSPEIYTESQVIIGHDGSRGYFNQSGWSHSNNDTTHTMTVSFPVEGTYVVTVEGVDLAKRELSPQTSGEFVIDWTQPTINISGVTDHQAYGDAIQPVVTINDANMSPQTTCQVNNLGITKGNPFQTSPAASDAQYTYSYANPERIPDNDGVYRITVNAYDMAGNTSMQTLAWSVNRFGSTYVIDENTEKMMDGYVNDKSIQDVIVHEINPSDIVACHVNMTKGPFTETLNEGSDYTTSTSGGGDSWVERVYTISKNFFKEDNHYSINYLSTDAAGNENDNTMDNKNAERNAKVNVKFMLDNAKPTSYFTNLSEDIIDTSRQDASVVFEDNSKEFESAEVTIDGETEYIDGKKLKEDKNYQVKFELADSVIPHQISVKSTDKAGNEMDQTNKSVVVSTNPFVLWFYNTPLFIGTLVALAAIAGGLIYFFVKRRKKEEDGKAGK